MNTRNNVVIPILLYGAATAPSPLSPLTAAINIQASHSPVANRFGRWTNGTLWWWMYQTLSQANGTELNYTTFLTRHLDEADAPLIQINSSQRGLVWKSPRLPADGLPFDRDKWDAAGDDWQPDTLDLSGSPVRRVVYKGGAARGGWGGWGGPTRPEPRPSAPPPVTPRPAPPGPNINYYQVARPTTELETAVADIHLEADRSKEALAHETTDKRQSVRLLLGLGSVIAFAGTLFGGWVVVGVGLRPLRKLTAAVSKVSEKDFCLPVKASELSRELVPIHDRLAHALDALRLAFEREKQAVADISHELRTPVAGLLATIDVTLRKPRTAEQYKQALEDSRGIAKQLGGLVERVMTLAYLDAGHTTTAATQTDAAEVAQGCAAVIRPLAESHGLTLTTDVRPTSPLSTDPDKLREVMINLLHNAVEYNQPGGSVRLAVRREANGGPVVVEVSDTGIGMTPDVRGRIFERFFRANPSRTATGVHAGLGWPS